MSNNLDSLLVQNQFLESIYNGTDMAIFVIDVDKNGVFRYAGLNPKHEEITGFTSDWIKGRTPEELAPRVPEEACQVLKANYQKCLDAGETIKYEEMIPMDGKNVWWLTTLIPLKDENESIYRIIGSANNIDELKQKEAILKEQKSEIIAQNEEYETLNEELRTLTEELEERVEDKTFNLKERIKELKGLYNISKIVQKTELSIDEMLAQIVNIIPPSWQIPELTYAKIIWNKKSFATNNYKETEYQLNENIIVNNKKQGELIIGYTQKINEIEHDIFLKEEYDLIKGYANQIGDIIESKETMIMAKNSKSSLVDSEKRFRLLSENAKDMIYRMSLPDGKYEYVSPASKEIFGFTPKEFYETPGLIVQLIHEDYHEFFKNAWEALMNGIVPEYYEYQAVDKDGVLKWINQRNSGIKNENGELIAIEGIVTDYTHIKQKEIELAEKNIEYQQLNEEFQSQNEELKTINEELEERNAEYEKLNEELKTSHEQQLALLDGIDDIVYVADPDTFEILYFNRTARDIWGNATGEKCYKVLQNRDEPCPFCTNDKIFGKNEGKAYVWEFQNEVTKEWYRCSDKAIKWSNGKMVRFELASNITESKKLQTEIEINEQKIKKVIENSPLGILIYDSKGDCISANPISAKLVGANREQVLKQNFRQIESWKKSGLLELAEEVLEKGVYKEKEIHVTTSFGKDVYLDCHLSRYTSEGNYHLLVMINNISEKKVAEKELISHKERLSSLIKYIPTGIVLIDKETRSIEELNPYALEKIGRNEKEIVGSICTDFFCSAQIGNCPICDLKQEVDLSEKTIKNAKGEYIPILKSVTPIIINGKEKLLESFIDISEQKEIENQLKQSEEKFRSLVTNNEGIVYIIAKDGTFLLSEGKGLADVSLEPGQVVGESVFELYKNFPDMLNDMRRTFEGETVINESDVGGIYFRSWYTPQRNENGEIDSLLGLSVNITELKNTMKALNRSEEELQENLIKLENSNIELQNFAYVASHDLQEPLRMVTSFLELIKKRYTDKLDETGNEFIDFAVDGSNRMKQLINDLLTFSRVGTRGKEFLKTNLNDVFAEVKHDLTLAIEENNFTIIAEQLPELYADQSQMKQLFQNLVSNAIKFRNSEKPQLEIRVEENKSKYLFSFKDNGLGIEKEHFERIFVIFQRLHGREEFPGTGIGLAICKKIVERHNGKIWLESEPGKGTTFYLTIPKKLK